MATYGNAVYFIFSVFCVVAGEQWVEKNSDVSVERLLTTLVKPVINNSSATTEKCRMDNQVYRNALRSYTPWAVQMYDASAKVPFGILTGNFMQLGNYDECLQVKSDAGFSGKACVAKITFTFWRQDRNKTSGTALGHLSNVAASKFKDELPDVIVPYEWLWCVPSSCGASDISNVLETVVAPLRNDSSVKIHLDVHEDGCRTLETDRHILNSADAFYISLLVIFGFIVFFSTVYDLITEKNPDRACAKGVKYSVMTSFSLYTNGKYLLSTKRSTDTINCLDSIRFLSICFIIYFHLNIRKFIQPQLNAIDMTTMYKNWASALVFNAHLAVDTFLFMTGILQSYNELKRREDNPEKYRLNILKYYLHRYIRLTPAYAIIIGFHATLFYKIGSGPKWHDIVGPERNQCVSGWWLNLLYINNYFPKSQRCIGPSWYLAVDMQLHLIAPIFLYPLIFKGIKHLITIIIFSVGFALTILATFLLTLLYGLMGMPLFFKDQISTNLPTTFFRVYIPMYTRCAPFLIGLILGYFLQKYRKNPPRIRPIWILCGWLVAVFAGLTIIFASQTMYYRDYEYEPIWSSFYAAFHRIIFTLAIGWIILATQLGYSGPARAFLHWCGWVPFSKLTYCIYLTHNILLVYNAGIARTPSIFNTWTLVNNYFGVLVLIIMAAAVLCLCFEMPFSRLIRLFTRNSENDKCTDSSDSAMPGIRGFKFNECKPESIEFHEQKV